MNHFIALRSVYSPELQGAEWNPSPEGIMASHARHFSGPWPNINDSALSTAFTTQLGFRWNQLAFLPRSTPEWSGRRERSTTSREVFG